MKKLVVAALVTAAFVAAWAAPSFAEAMMNFGSPPSGQIPILYNDHHVYARPDVIRRDRVLAAIVRGGTLLVPLRSMFEAMGATVTYDPASRSVTAKKTGASITVTVGKSEAVINGETRPLDQGPIMFQGHVLVPVRAISETLGAYVEWVPSQRVVVVRYKPAAPVPPPPPTAVPTPTPTPAPTKPPTYFAYVQAGYTIGRVSNEFTDGTISTKGNSWVAQGGVLFGPWAVVGDFRQDSYDTPADFAVPPLGQVCDPTGRPPVGTPVTVFNTIDGGTCFVIPFRARQSTIDGRVEYKVADPHIYVNVGYLQANNNYGYARLNAVEFGVQKLPDFRVSALSWFGSAEYSPTASGNYTVSDPLSPNFGVTFKQRYNIIKYDVGLTYTFGQGPIYVYGGFSGDNYQARSIACPNPAPVGPGTPPPPAGSTGNACGPGQIGAPVNQSHAGPYLGLGLFF